MKNLNLKIFKLNTVIKRLNLIKDYILKIYKKNIREIQDYFFKFFPLALKNTIHGIKGTIKFLINYFTKIFKYFLNKNFNFFKIYKNINIKNYKKANIYFVTIPIFLILIYLCIPFAFNYNKSDIEKEICNSQNIKCSIKGSIKYSPVPTPRVLINDIVIYDTINNKNIFANIKIAEVKLPLFDLIKSKKKNYKKIILKNFVINFNLNNTFKYKKFIFNPKNFIKLELNKGEIKLLDDINYVASISNVNVNLTSKENLVKAILKGKFLDDDLYIKVDNKQIDSFPSKNILLKMSNAAFLAKISLISKNKLDGKILLKKGKNKFTSLFSYSDNKIIFNNSNLRNTFLDGKMTGQIKLLPYFNFDLDLNLNSINFSTLSTAFFALNENDQKKLFKINSKINGKLDLIVNKIYSKHSLIKSIESRLKFTNGSLFVEQFLINLGKLGAADLLGTLNNDNDFTNFKFESNIYLDNKRKFFSKFGVYNKENIPSNSFVSGGLNFNNYKMSLYEISALDKLSEADVDYIEKEFNNLMLQENLKSLFDFNKFKEFVQLVLSDEN